MPGGNAWKARYDAKYPKEFQVYSPYTYDAVGVLVDAMVRAGSTDPKVYGPLLFKADYQGVTSKICFEADGELKKRVDDAVCLQGRQEGAAELSLAANRERRKGAFGRPLRCAPSVGAEVRA